MANINHVVLIGRLTRDAELKYTNTGLAICKFSLALNRRKKVGDQWTDEANFFDVTAFGKTGETIHPYLVKGKQIGIQGELRQNRWEQDGQPRTKVEVVAFSIQLLGSKGQTNQTVQPDASGFQSNESDYTDNFEDDVPF